MNQPPVPEFSPDYWDNYSTEMPNWASEGEPDIGQHYFDTVQSSDKYQQEQAEGALGMAVRAVQGAKEVLDTLGNALGGTKSAKSSGKSANGVDKSAKVSQELDIDALVLSAQIPIDVPTIDVPYIKPVTLSEEFDMLGIELIVKCAYDGDFGDAMLLKELYQGRLCYDSSVKKADEGWYFWAGHHWRKDPKGMILISSLIPTKLAAQYLKAKSAIQEQLATPPADNPFKDLVGDWDDDKDFKKNLKAIATKLGKKAASLSYAGKLNPIFRFARSLMVATDPYSDFDVWDSNPWLLPVKNGVLGLRDGQVFFRNGLPSDYVRTYAPVDWQGIDTPDVGFAKFLSEVLEGAQDHRETIDYVQRLLGYSILGSAHENNFAILYGDRGQNGKGTLFKILGKVLGSLCGSVSEDVFLSKKKSNAGAASPHLMTLRGLRVAWCAETDEGERLNGSQVKRLTGNEPLRGRALNQNEVQWEPTHTLFLMTNNKPHVNAEDNALWLRIAMIPFTTSFVKNPTKPHERKANPHLVEALTTEEGKSSILALLVKWCIRYQKEGLALPNCLQAELEEYRSKEDAMRDFIDECCFVSEDAQRCLAQKTLSKTRVKSSEIYKAYKAWHLEYDKGFPMGRQAFKNRMERRFYCKRLKTGVWFFGVKMLESNQQNRANF